LRPSAKGLFLNRGRWDLQLVPSPSYVATDFRGPRGERPEGGVADGWNEILVTSSGAIRYVLSGKPGGIHGVVNGPGHEPVPGAAVLLETYDPDTRKRIHDLRTFRADMSGRYQIYGLAPGTYRVLSTFDLETPEPDEVELLSPRTLKVEEGRDHQLDLDLAMIYPWCA
jgi:hypothetical protein